MTKETMSIHQGLCELKILDDRIKKSMQGVSFAVANKHSNTKIDGISLGEFTDRVRASYQSTNDLVARRNAIKSAIVLSNATTEVVVGGKSLVVAEAIEFKNHGINILKSVLSKLHADYSSALRAIKYNNDELLEGKADEHIKNMFGTEKKDLTDECIKARNEFIKAQTFDFIDPLKIVSEMEKLEKEISNFQINIDTALSVSNALTHINIEY